MILTSINKDSVCYPDRPPTVSVIIVNWNGKEYLPDCLNSLLKQSFTDFETILVDNGSTDGSIELLKNFYPWVRIMPLSQNTGFASGNNKGFACSHGKYIVTLNNDTRLEMSWLAELISAVENNPEIGMVASRICTWDNRDKIDSLGVAVCRDGMSRAYRRNALFSTLSLAKVEDILIPSACAALYRRKMIDEIGFFDDAFFAYCEDTDLGLRGRLSGWRAVLARDAIVYHRYSGSGGIFSPLKLYLVERNHFWVALKCFPLIMLLSLPFWTVTRYLLQIQIVLIRPRGAGIQFRNSSSCNLLKALLRGIIDMSKEMPSIFHKRRVTMSIRRISSKEIRILLKKYKLTFKELLDAS
ncbi:MAG TPA: glycosyltransferase family 2 protein [Lentisphaeria bacterium]|nr:MAG: glycosyl transferase [Lentisphaerae bacterium GWF2_38_69]HBM15199.1 glycosyltransferase family 2 protein [Lentisphaeria bacterium]